jgi:hypothetical protein
LAILADFSSPYSAYFNSIIRYNSPSSSPYRTLRPFYNSDRNRATSYYITFTR